ncbi:peptidoglycan-binding protein [Pseudomonas putida]|uniref:FimV/HubP family polar landmark protein n=1 Tax=Pseudomonas putida TaxID=303 RepID=UPI0023639933|nr:FimV/HubP family polar landmark protein [Pseudomonas putida]MDD2052404.1 peptidoglycan-binding protein [Pseudomonas putida]
MVQVRKLVLAIAAASALSSGMAQALELGELTLKSATNQPLLAEIELLDVGGLNVSDVVPSLASPKAFSDAGVNREQFLDDLTFTPVLNPGGRSLVRVTSQKPLPEGYLRLLVQVQWPNGRLMRDYSVLLDPAKYAPTAPPAAVAPATTPGNASASNASSSASPATSQPAEYKTAARDTLWEIAARNRNGASVQQTMLAIQALNPGAFIDGNINRLKAGQVLRLPDPVQSASLTQTAAIAEVAAQNAAWRQGRRTGAQGRQQVDATGRAGNKLAPAKAAGKDSLSLVSAESGKARGKGAAGDSKNIGNKLAVTQESLDAARRDNAELKSRMADLQSQLDKLQRLIELKNDQLAKLQAAGEGAAPAANTAMPAELVAQPAPAPVVAPESAAPEAAAAQDEADATSAKKLDDLLGSPLLLWLIGGSSVLVLLLLLLLLARRRKAQLEAEKHVRMARALAEETDFSADLDLPQSSFEGLEVPAASVKLNPAPAPAPAPAPVQATPVPAPAPAPLPAPVVAAPVERSSDALEQAESHIQRGHLNQAAEVLEEAIKLEPARSDLRLKLMEVYGRQGDRDAFVGQERQLIATGDNHAQVEELKSRFPAMVVVAAAAGLGAAAAAAELDAQYVKELLLDEELEPEPQAAPVVEAPEPVVADDAFAALEDDLPIADIDGLDAEFDLSLDDLDPPAAGASAEVLPAEVPLDEFPLDDDLDFESVLQQQTEAAKTLEDLSDFDLDLDLGSDDALSSSAEKDFLLGLEDELKDLPATEPSAADPASLDDLTLPADFDLSLADEPEAPNAFTAELDDVNAELERLSKTLEQAPITTPSFGADDALGDDETEFDFLSGTDEAATKLDLAQAFLDMGDADGARDILDEVLKEGNPGQQKEAQEMLLRLI